VVGVSWRAREEKRKGKREYVDIYLRRGHLDHGSFATPSDLCSEKNISGEFREIGEEGETETRGGQS